MRDADAVEPEPDANAVPADDRGAVVAILAPHGRDAALARDLLAGEGVAATVIGSLDALVPLLRDHVGAVVVTEEALAGPGDAAVHAALADQPAWSDIPFVVLANGTARARSPQARARMDALRNAVLLSRPLHAEELLRAVRSALGARGRQYEARARMEELELREAQLRDSEAKFHAIANSIDQMVWSTRPDGFHDYYNDRWYAFTGVPHGSTDGEAWNGVFHSDDQARAWESWRRSLATGDPYEIEYRLRHASGDYRWVLGRAQAVRDPSGAITRWYGTCTDIDDQVRARETLARSREELAALVETRAAELTEFYNHAPAILYSLDAGFRLTAISDRFVDFAGYDDRTDIIGRSVFDFIHPHGGPEEVAPWVQMFHSHGGELDNSVGTFRRRGGDDATIVANARMVTDADGTVTQVHAALTDVSARLKAERERDETAEALRQSQKLEMIGQLTGGVAHDFNNLLMAIRSSLDLLGRRLPAGDDRTARYLANAVSAVDRGAGLTQRMLAFARKQDLRADAVDVGTLLPGLRDLLQRSLGPQIEIAVDVAAPLRPALVDANQLEMAVLNLAVNARDAIDGAGRLTLVADMVQVDEAADLDPGGYVRIAVGDTGAGMDEATLAQAMEPFFTTKGVGKGTGLGLPMVHGLAKQSGGAFRLESAPGAGTTATLYLPVAATTTDAAAEAAPDQAPPEPRRAKDRLTILAVDDDILVSMGTVGLLEDLGHEVIETHSGEAALEVLTARPDIDVLMTDQAMPKMTGVELARRARALRPDLPIILATGYAEMPEGGADCITARLEKPFSDASLARTLEAL